MTLTHNTDSGDLIIKQIHETDLLKPHENDSLKA